MNQDSLAEEAGETSTEGDATLGDFFYDPQSPTGQGNLSGESIREQLGEREHRTRQRSASDTQASLADSSFESEASPSTARATAFGAFGADRQLQVGKRQASRPSLLNAMHGNSSAPDVLDPNSEATATATRTSRVAERRCLSSLDTSALLSGFRELHDGEQTARPKLLPALSDEDMRIVREGEGLAASSSGMLDEDSIESTGSPLPAAGRNRQQLLSLKRTSHDGSARAKPGASQVASPRTAGVTAMKSSPSDVTRNFGASETEGKVLPCFTVKEDGLVRIKAVTLIDLLGGKYDSQIEGFTVVDCRFDYEHSGGKVPGAVNLSTVEAVKQFLLTPGDGLHTGRELPPRSTSGRYNAAGERMKHVLVFHCEFSAKRAPSMARAFRQADRLIASDYPNCHFPELYILEGGYCSFFQQFPQVCQPPAYVPMDDPQFQERRSNQLNGFRKQFSRHRSFTYGEARTEWAKSKGASSHHTYQPIKLRALQEANEKGSSSPSQSDVSMTGIPSIATKSTAAAKMRANIAKNLLAVPLPEELSRTASTSEGLAGEAGTPAAGTAAAVGGEPMLADLSRSSDDSSFDQSGAGASPCAAVGKRRPAAPPSLRPSGSAMPAPPSALFAQRKASGLSAAASPTAAGKSKGDLTAFRPGIARKPFQRAGTTANIMLGPGPSRRS